MRGLLQLRHLVITMTAVAVAAGIAVAQPRTPAAGAGSGSGSAARPTTTGAGSGSAAAPGTGSGSGLVPAGTATGAGSGAAPAEPAEPAMDDAEVDTLRQEYLKLRDELFESRARAATVASQLYSTKVTLKLAYTTGRMYGVSRASIRLDGASVYDNTEGTIAADDGIRFEGYIAPGRHVLTFRVEAGGKDDNRFTSSVESTVVVQAVGGKDLIIAAKAKDAGDIAYSWKKKEQGTYKLGLDIDVRSVKRPTEKSDKKAAAPKRGGNATASR